MQQIFDSQVAASLAGPNLHEARAFILLGLQRVTQIPLGSCGDSRTIDCTDVRSVEPQSHPFALTWQGFVGSSNYRDDEKLVYGAHLFPLIGGRRSCIVRMRDGKPSYDYAFRYLMLTPEADWEDRGWQVDDCGEFEHWYLEDDR
jgi:hypothetical protein